MPSSPLSAPEMAAPEAPPRFRAPRLMGVINVTPDSFYAGGRSASTEAAFARGLRLVEEGADFLDIGGQSTRPGSEPATREAQRERGLTVVKAVAQIVAVPISIDTDKARVAAEALDAGARIVNDVTALRGDPDMARVAARAERVVLMHMRGASPKTMQADTRYGDVVREVREFLAERLEAFEAAGGDRKRVWVDPGVGFGKNLEQNLALIKHAGELASLAPVLLGVSRKSFLGGISSDEGPEERLPGSLALAAWAGFVGLDVLRVHDVGETKRALAALAAVAGIA
ncbi:MAG: dihydropteroate synthase [Elusimicrobiota bacterium]